jgi:hypothetical protein
MAILIVAVFPSRLSRYINVSVDPKCGNLVTASYPMQLMIPFANYSVTLQAQSCFAVQQP